MRASEPVHAKARSSPCDGGEAHAGDKSADERAESSAEQGKGVSSRLVLLVL